ncbi:PLP-dependent transferase [Synechococcus sp. RSCCF101]|uniref:PLP-dependent transferase n=1 Tax=Synechococcus sp. RSCCF101 TaxID=2511069 RepID=UPI001248CFBE|nr:PLP-dependent transferase [Synechococcus sp. RSCCF101]QEY30913.1 PLP-dependent transferase [Synechococcus sp. RSCCF101]
MSGRNLLLDPCWQAIDLGHPLPDSPHAVSVALPRWRDVVAYEENDPACRAALRTAYPRFVMHPLLREVAEAALAQTSFASAWPFPSQAAAELARAHCLRVSPGSHTAVVPSGSLWCLLAAADATPAATAFWQHTGLGASSRLAAQALGREPVPPADHGRWARRQLQRRLAAIHGGRPERVRLLPSGMAALDLGLRAISALRPGRPTLQVGFPYVDVLKLPQVIHSGGELVLNGEPERLAEALDRVEPAAVIVELPSNPMLGCVDLPALAALTRARGIPLVVDDTIGSSLNIETRPHADLVFTSLTKSFAGRGDILAGSLVVSEDSPWREPLTALTAEPAAELSDADAIALERASRDVADRVARLNHHCALLAARLEGHPAVARVLHPAASPAFRRLLRPGGGSGCLLSFELRGGEASAARVYDSLRVCKGPSLGTPFTLVCPYVLLAHYHELAWAEGCGVPRSLLRVSVGLEPPEELWQRFESALERA